MVHTSCQSMQSEKIAEILTVIFWVQTFALKPSDVCNVGIYGYGKAGRQPTKTAE